MTDTISQWIVDALLEAGKSPIIDGEYASDALASVCDCDYINRLHWQDWNTISERLSLDDLVALAKALTIADAQFHWIGGSVAAVIWVVNSIRRRDADTVQTLSDWIRPRSTNQYIRLDPKPPTEEDRQRQERYDRNQREAEATQVAYAAERIAILAEMEPLSSGERLCRIASDETRNATYYPSEWMVVDDEVIQGLPSKVRAHLKERLGLVRNSPWSILRGKLIATEQRVHAAQRNEILTAMATLCPGDRLRRIAGDGARKLDYYPAEWALIDDETVKSLPPDVRTALLKHIGTKRKGPWSVLRRKLLEVNCPDMAEHYLTAPSYTHQAQPSPDHDT